MKKYTYVILALLCGAQNMWGAAAAKNILTSGAKLLWAGTAAGTAYHFGPTIKAAADQYLKPSTEHTLAELALALTKQQPAAAMTAEQLQSAVAAGVKEVLARSGVSAQPAEYSWSYVGPLLSLMANHKVLSGLIGTIGIGATVYASHEGTRNIVRERFTALGTALERLKEQLMARMNGIEQQVAQGTEAIGNALNEAEQLNTARFNQLAQLIAATAIAQQQGAELPVAPTFEAQTLYTGPAVAAQTVDTTPLMPAEQRGLFARMRSWFSA